VVNRHNGRLVIDSEPGRGSVFTVSLPAALDPPAQT
jgi:signal transduction histidine kinase